jgi:hypothetical protein
MCVTCLGSNQHTHSSHKSCSARLHNLYKHRYTDIKTLVLNGNPRHVCTYANVNLTSHTNLLCENVVFSEPCCLENKCEVEKAFSYFTKQ